MNHNDGYDKIFLFCRNQWKIYDKIANKYYRIVFFYRIVYYRMMVTNFLYYRIVFLFRRNFYRIVFFA